MSRGRLMLLGSGEFTSAMDRIDGEMLASLRAKPKVAIVPTAAGEEDTPPKWIDMGSEHFRALGAEPVGVNVLTRADAHEATWRERIADADWIYFSGGSPGYVVETLTGTPFWSAVVARHAAGAILAGSSGGAMMLGGTTMVPTKRGPDGLPTETTMRAALGLLPRIIIAPHFDIFPPARLARWVHSWPAGHLLLGIDEDTAVIENGGWTARGRGRVVVGPSFEETKEFRDGAAVTSLAPSVLPKLDS